MSNTTLEPVAWQFRWKIDGAWTRWHVSDTPVGGFGALKDVEVRPLYKECVAAPTSNERFHPRFLILDDYHLVCVGGRWDGWRFYRHPDGGLVSVERMKELPKA